MYKNGTGINIDKIDEKQGDYKNGLEVSVQVKTYRRILKSALQPLIFFKGLKVVVENKNDITSYWDNVKNIVTNIFESPDFQNITEYKSFVYVRGGFLNISKGLKLGNVYYPIDFGAVGIKPLDTNGIIFKLPIGTLDITPSREAIQYTERSKQAIIKIKKRVQEELTQVVQDYLNTKLTTTKEVFNAVLGTKDVIYMSLDNKSKTPDTVVPVSIQDLDPTIKLGFTFNGIKYDWDFVKYIQDIKHRNIPAQYIYKVSSGRNSNYLGSKNSQSIGSIIEAVKQGAILYHKEDRATKATTIEWIKQKNGSFIVLQDDFADWIKNKFTVVGNNLSQKKAFLEDFLDLLDITPLNNSDVPEDFTKQFQTERKRALTTNDDFTVRRYTEYGYNNYPSRWLNQQKGRGLFLYAPNTKDDAFLKDLCNVVKSNATIITVPAKTINLFKNRRQFMDITSFMYNKNKLLQKIVTAAIVSDHYLDLQCKYNICIRDYPIGKEYIKVLRKWRCGSNKLLDSIVKYYKDKGWEDKCILKQFLLSNKDIKDALYSKALYEKDNGLIKSLLYNHCGNNPKVGITPTPNILDFLKYENIQVQ